MNEPEPISVEEVWAILRGPPVSVGYHGTKALSEVLAIGLRVDRTRMPACRHICLSPTLELAAVFAYGVQDGGVLHVDLTGLDVPPFSGHEARCHVDISPDRLSLVTDPIEPSMARHLEPARAYGPIPNHPHCWPYLESGRAVLGLA